MNDLIKTVLSEDLHPLEFFLSQNYPDPAKGNTVIKYCIPYKSLVQLKIFKENGDELEVMLNEVKNPGTYEITLSTENYPDGVYLYLLHTEKFSKIKRMTVLKSN